MFEGEILAVDAGVDVGGNHGGLDEEGAGAAHWVEERFGAVVAGNQEDACGEDLVDGGFVLGFAPAALVQGVAGRVERECDIFALDVDVDADIGVVEANTRTFVGAVAVDKPVDDGVFHAVGDET